MIKCLPKESMLRSRVILPARPPKQRKTNSRMSSVDTMTCQTAHQTKNGKKWKVLAFSEAKKFE